MEVSRRVINTLLKYKYGKSIMGKVAKTIDPWSAAMYAKYILEAPWPEGEEQIAKSFEASKIYYRDVLAQDGIYEWELGKKVFANDNEMALFYASRNGEPFPEGEEAIAQDGYTAFQYARLVLHGPFEKGEEAIVNGIGTNGAKSWTALDYIREILAPAGETDFSRFMPIIQANPSALRDFKAWEEKTKLGLL